MILVWLKRKAGNPITAAIFLLACSSGLLHAQGASTRLETEWQELDSTVVNLHEQKDELDSLITVYGLEIESLKDKNTLNYFQRQRLERLLKDSQDLSVQMESIDNRVAALQRRQSRLSNGLIRLYEDEIKRYLASLEVSAMPPEKRQTILNHIARLRKKKDTLKATGNSQGVHQVLLAEIQIDPDDTPRRVKQKADLLKDQEDKLLRYSSQMSEKLADLQQELALRNRIDDMVADIALFDQQDEALGNFDTAPGSEKTASDAVNIPAEDFLDEQVRITDPATATQGQSLLTGQKDYDYAILSSEQLEILIEQLSLRKENAGATADSLATRAEAFYEKAEEMEKQ
jgi:hypothetical protein